MDAGSHAAAGNGDWDDRLPTVEGYPPPRDEDPNYDCDSEELEALEDAAEAEAEQTEEEELEKLVSEATLMYPPEWIEHFVAELKEDGMVNLLRNRIFGSVVSIRHLLIALGVLLPRSLRSSDVPQASLVPILKSALARILRRRAKLPQYNTVDDVVELLRNAKKVIVLSGAGISVSCGIPDFRSKDGIYANLQQEGKYELDDPQDMFDKEYFLANPACFYSFAHSIFPSNFTPSPTHRFIKLLESRGKLLRNYSQNIDTLEQEAGIERVLQCHGSFATASCVTNTCTYRHVPGATIRPAILERQVPRCPVCAANAAEARASGAGEAPPKKPKRKAGEWHDGESESDSDSEEEGWERGGPYGRRATGILKPDITFFGEKLSDEFDRCLFTDREEVDLLLVMGTSLKVAPVSELVAHLPHSTPTVLINRTPVLHLAMDVQLLGDADGVVRYLCGRLGWELPDAHSADAGADAVEQPQRMLDSHFWRFPGAEPGRLVELLSSAQDESGSGSDEEDDGEEETPAVVVVREEEVAMPDEAVVREAGTSAVPVVISDGRPREADTADGDERESKRARVDG